MTRVMEKERSTEMKERTKMSPEEQERPFLDIWVNEKRWRKKLPGWMSDKDFDTNLITDNWFCS